MDDWGSISDFLNSRMNYFVGVYFEPNPEKNLHLRLENRLSMSFLYTDETIFQEVLQGALNFWAQTEQAERYELTTTSLAQLDLKSNIHQFALSQNASPGNFAVFMRRKEHEKEEVEELLQEAICNLNSPVSENHYLSPMYFESVETSKADPKKTFMQAFPKFSRYCDPDRIDSIKKRKQRLLNLFSDTHCLLYLILIPIFLVSLQQMPDYEKSQMLTESVQKGFKITSAHESSVSVVSEKKGDLQSVKTFSEFTDWFFQMTEFVFGEDLEHFEESFAYRNILVQGLSIQAVLYFIPKCPQSKKKET